MLIGQSIMYKKHKITRKNFFFYSIEFEGYILESLYFSLEDAKERVDTVMGKI